MICSSEHPAEEPFYGEVPHLIPEKYGNPKTCDVAPVTVEKGKKNVFDFDLKNGS